MTSRRNHTRRWCSSSFIGSGTGARPRRAQISWVSLRRYREQRAHDVTRAGAPSPTARPRAAPRNICSSTVSAWSSRVCATRIASAPTRPAPVPSAAYRAVARPGLEVRPEPRRRRDRHERRAETHRRGPHGRSRRGRSRAQAVVDVHRIDVETAVAREREERQGVGATPARRRRRSRPRARSSSTVGRGSHPCGVDARRARVRVRSAPRTVGRFSGASPHGVERRPAADLVDAAHEPLADLVLAHLLLDAEQLVHRARDAADLAPLRTARATCAPGPATCSRPRSSITTLPWPSSTDISACTLASTPRCAGDANSPTSPPSSSGLRPARTSSTALETARSIVRGSGSTSRAPRARGRGSTRASTARR